MSDATPAPSLSGEQLSQLVWRLKYRDPGPPEEPDLAATWDRVARALAAPEKEPAAWTRRFTEVLAERRFLPGGRILANAGVPHLGTLFNCFVMGVIDDSMEGIFDALREGAVTMQRGGGVGYDFSTLRPRGSEAHRSGTTASGPVSFLRVWDATCSALLESSRRRGAMMATLRCDHPDIEEFIEAKLEGGGLTNFNLSVLVTDAFLGAARTGEPWPLVFPAPTPGAAGLPTPVRTVDAAGLWRRLVEAAYRCGDPGVLFVDRINRLNNLWYREHLTATNPCGEVPLPPYGACDLGSLNLPAFVEHPFEPDARLDYGKLAEVVAIACRMLDNVIDVSAYPLAAQAEQARGCRRIGLGVTGLADAFLQLGVRYGSDASVELAEQILRSICLAAYETSIELAREKGEFPYLERDRFLQGEFVRTRLPDELRRGIGRGGLRNSHLLAVAPAGTISLLAGGVSNGLEPVAGLRVERTIRDETGVPRRYILSDAAWSSYREGHDTEPPPGWLVDATAVTPHDQLRVQAAVQTWVDGAVSKTVSVPADLDFEGFRDVFELADELGLKGCTAFRAAADRAVVRAVGEAAGAGHCCSVDREAD